MSEGDALVKARNFEAVSQQMALMGRRIDVLEERLRGADAKNASLSAEVQSLKQQVIMATINGAGRGPTAR